MGFGGISIWSMLLLLVLLPLAFLPTIIALIRNHPHKLWIILLNIFGGLLWGIGWVIALIWSFIIPKNSRQLNMATEIEKLHELKEKGALTQQEFDSKKNSLLNS